VGGSSATNTDLAFFTGNTNSISERLRITNSGDVGIGTTNPSVNGLEISRNTGGASPNPAELRLSTTTNEQGTWSTTDPWGRLSFFSADVSAGGAKVQASIQTVAGNINGGFSSLDFLIVPVSGDDIGVLQRGIRLQPESSSRLSVIFSRSNTEETMRITSTGNVGIGTTSPNQLLEISKDGSSTATAPAIRINNTHTTIDAGNEYGRLEFYANDTSTGGVGITGYIASQAINAGVTSALVFGNRNSGNAVEMMRLNNLGNLLLNTTTALTGGGRLQVNGNINIATVANATGDFLTHVNGLVNKRTATQVRTDISAIGKEANVNTPSTTQADRLWVGTLADYNAITTKSNEVIYYIL
jgi:hypothetical protein